MSWESIAIEDQQYREADARQMCRGSKSSHWRGEGRRRGASSKPHSSLDRGPSLIASGCFTVRLKKLRLLKKSRVLEGSREKAIQTKQCLLKRDE
ncbi:hypothetical protein TNCV_2858061 [Trichonephila clavipes]|nr:hypothetical protein TNCV_2858061 [Trichonephila clavipes]